MGTIELRHADENYRVTIEQVTIVYICNRDGCVITSINICESEFKIFKNVISYDDSQLNNVIAIFV